MKKSLALLLLCAVSAIAQVQPPSLGWVDKAEWLCINADDSSPRDWSLKSYGNTVTGVTVDKSSFLSPVLRNDGTSGNMITVANFWTQIGAASGATITVSFWVRAVAFDRIAMGNQGGTDIYFIIYSSSAYFVWGGSSPGQVLAADTWYHIVMTIDQPGNSLKMYVNGIEAASAACGNPSSGVSDLVILNYRSAEPAYSFNGYMDTLRIFKRILTPIEIGLLCENERGLHR